MTVEIQKKFFDNECLDFIDATIEESKNTACLRASYPTINWMPEIIHNSAPVLIYDIHDSEILNQNLKSKIEFEGDAIFMIYYWPTGSYIPWHNDAHAKLVGTLYCNTWWHRDWGGAFLYEDGDKTLAEFPEYNKLVIQRDNTWHCTTPVQKQLYHPIDWEHRRIYPEYNQGRPVPITRTTLQIFMELYDKKNMYN
jgi:hypothetical protein